MDLSSSSNGIKFLEWNKISNEEKDFKWNIYNTDY